MTTTILSQNSRELMTVELFGAGAYNDDLRLIRWRINGSTISLDLDHAELLALLRVLSTALLLKSLGERGLTEALALDDTPQAGDDEPVPERFCSPVASYGDTAPHRHWCLECRRTCVCHAMTCSVMTTPAW